MSRTNPPNPSTSFHICEAVDPDTDEYSSNINAYTIESILQCNDAEFTDCPSNDSNDFSIAKKAASTTLSCNSLSPKSVELEIKKVLDNEELGLDREDVGFYKIKGRFDRMIDKIFKLSCDELSRRPR